MARSQLIVGLDIGSSKTRVVVGVNDERDNLDIIGVGIAPSHGIRKGVVIDMEEAIQNITVALEDAERVSGEPIYSAFVGISGKDIKSVSSEGVISILHGKNEITIDDVDRVLDASQTLQLSTNRKILRTVPRSFSVDNQKNIKYPVGMIGSRLKVDVQFITGLIPAIKNIEKCVHQTGVDIRDIIPALIAPSDAIASRHKRELGCVVIDIGAGTTNFCVYEGGTLLHSNAIAIGAENVTNDIAICLRSAVDTAEKLKIEYGSCDSESVRDKEEVDLSKISRVDTQMINRKYLTQIIEARYREIFNLIKKDLVSIGRDAMLPAGVLLCGGGAKIDGIVGLTKDVLRLPAQVEVPYCAKGMPEVIEDPGFATAIGLAVNGMKMEGNRNTSSKFSLSIKKTLIDIKGWIKDIL